MLWAIVETALLLQLHGTRQLGSDILKQTRLANALCLFYYLIS